MGDWLRTGNIAPSPRIYRPFEQARTFARSLDLKSSTEWYTYGKSGKRPSDIPSNPNVAYRDLGWLNMGDWLGTDRVSNRDVEFRPFEQARAFVRNLGLNSSPEWRNYCKSGKRPSDIPSNPQRTYRNEGWSGWGDWLGSGFIATHLRKYRPFEQARTFAQNLGLKSSEEWKKYCKSGKLPIDIPNNVKRTYRNEGWSNWGDWLGYD